MSEVKIIERKRAYNGYLKVDLLTVDDRGRNYKLELIERGNSVAVLIFDPITMKALVTEQVRPCHLDKGGVLTGLVAGMIDKGESSEEAMVRETKEETGLNINPQELISLGKFYLSAGILTEWTEVFLYPMDLDSIQEKYDMQTESENEYITVKLMSVFTLKDSKEIKQATLQIALQSI